MVTPASLPRRLRGLRDRGGGSASTSEIPLGVTVRRTPCVQEVPAQFLCPISLEMMRDPVAAPTGITYDRESVEAWLERGRSTCPVSGRPLRLEDLVPNHATRRLIQGWCVAAGRAGERAPTPRVPVSALDASDLMAAVAAAAARGDGAACRELVARARALAKESERNRRCLASAGGAARALSSALCSLSDCRGGVLEEILAAMVVFSPLDQDSMRRIACSPASLSSVVSIASNAGLLPHSRASAAVVLREIASSSDSQCLDAMAAARGIHEALVSLLQSPPVLPPQATKAALVTAYYLATARAELAAPRMAELGIVRLLIELLVDCDKGTTEKALAALDAMLLTGGKAMEEACSLRALAVPVLVKRMHHVSDMATEFAVSALWRLCKEDDDMDGGSCKAEALQAGAFQKLLLLLQVGCEGVARERASELLRMLNASREEGAECIDTVDFKALKRPF